MSVAARLCVFLLGASLACTGTAPATTTPTATATGPRRAGAAVVVGPTGDTRRALGPITVDGLTALLNQRFSVQKAAGTFTPEWNGTDQDVLGELAAMGWTDLADVANAIPEDFDSRASIQFRLDDPANMPGLLRDFMILSDPHRYFGSAWQDHWGSLARGDAEVYRAYGIDLAPLRQAGVMDGP